MRRRGRPPRKGNLSVRQVMEWCRKWSTPRRIEASQHGYVNMICWEWHGGKDRDGYGKVGDRGKTWRAHRYVWFLLYQNIPEGKLILHSCNNPSCIRPSHLFLGTWQDNVHHMDRLGRRKTDVRNPQGESVLSDEEKSQLMERLKGGEGQRALARAFSVSRGTVKKYQQRL